eukprot:TRINITY_DN61934_c0_g1_i1.p1 TRINITY_DN61934_c0_g1~~TRINITY_DN61934_c0_g1_i1.p1  ORF type:complete len:843 (-),score=90.13 TRINITY_DN61934_c0_g1_i1:39-2525(-)
MSLTYNGRTASGIPGIFHDKATLHSKAAPPVQICFSFDTTGSMTACINEVRKQLTTLVKSLLDSIPGLQISILAHGDYCDENTYTLRVKDFSDDADALKKYIDACHNTAGGDAPECYELVLRECKKLSWKKGAAQALVIFGDADPHGVNDYYGINWEEEIKWYVDRNVHVYGVDCGYNVRFYKEISTLTNALVLKFNHSQMQLIPELFSELCFREQQAWATKNNPPPEWDIVAIKDPKLALMNVCGSCLFQEPQWREAKSVTMTRMVQLVKRLAKEGQGEFVCKLAVYARLNLYLRTTPSFLMVLAATTPGCHDDSAKFSKYFQKVCKLPSDVLAIATMCKTLPTEVVANQTIPAVIRRAIHATFATYTEFSLAKYDNTNAEKRKRMKASKAMAKDDAAGDNQRTKKKVVAPPTIDRDKVTLKGLVRTCHIAQPANAVCCILGKRYPSSAEDFVKAGLGEAKDWDESRADKRMKLPVPETWETQISQKGSTAEAWQTLIEHKKLPFMAMLRNLSNLVKSGISRKHVKMIAGRLSDEQQVVNSMQFPFAFLSAYLVVDQLSKTPTVNVQQDRVTRTGRKPKINQKPKKEPTDEQIVEREHAIEVYRNALDTAIKISAVNALPCLRGNNLVLVDVSGSMKYNQCVTSKGIQSLRTTADQAMLLGLLINYCSEDGKLVLFSEGKPNVVEVVNEDSVLKNYNSMQQTAGTMGFGTEFPVDFLEEQLDTKHGVLDSVVLISDMVIGLKRTHPGGSKFQQWLAQYRSKRNEKLRFVCLDLFGSGVRQAGVDDTGDKMDERDIIISGYSDSVLRFIALTEAGPGAQVQEVENVSV